MRNLILLLSIILVGTAGLSAQQIQLIDTEASTVSWVAKKVTGKHYGLIEIKEGQVNLDENGYLTGGEFTIDMTTISVEDIKNEKMNAKLVGHLNSADFFDVENHETAHFIIKSVEYVEGNANVTGNLTIKGITHETYFAIDLGHLNHPNFDVSTTFEIDRTLYDIKYGSGKFFDNLGDKTIYDNFTISIDLFAKK